MALTIGVPRETFAGEKRVATVPEVVEKLIKLGFAVAVESGAGEAANCDDASYRAAGATDHRGRCRVVDGLRYRLQGRRCRLRPEVGLMREGGTLIGYVWPAQNPETDAATGGEEGHRAGDRCPAAPAFPRAEDGCPDLASRRVAGYRAVIEAANAFGRFFNGQITAAGKVPPAKVFIAGAGVAGLAAIGTAAGLGAIVRANDTRAEVADQVVSLGGEFVKVDFEEEGSGGGGYAKVMSEGFQQAQREMYAKQAREVDIIITTALIPGKPAPSLITAEMVQSMKPGSVIVDMAAERGGNCELTEPGQAVVKHGVTIVGYTDLNSRLAKQSSTLYATNLFRLAEELCKTKDGVINVNMEDDAIRGLTVIKEGEHHLAAAADQTSGRQRRRQAGCSRRRHRQRRVATAMVRRPSRWPATSWRSCSAWPPRCSGSLAANAPAAFLAHFTVFVLACFVGYMVVWNVTPALHTPLMSVTNAISSIIAIGALVQIAPPLTGALATRSSGYAGWQWGASC
jgi:NAD(P) transhydrogenase subunit alpha